MIWVGLGVGIFLGVIVMRRRPAAVEAAEMRSFNIAVAYIAAYGGDAEGTILRHADDMGLGFGTRIGIRAAAMCPALRTGQTRDDVCTKLQELTTSVRTRSKMEAK